MNRKKILQLVLATSAIAGGMFLAQDSAIVEASPLDLGYTLNATNPLKQGQVVNVTTNLRIRSGAGIQYSTLGYLNNGAKISIKGESGNWYKINFNNKEGYVSKDYIRILNGTSATQTSSSNKQGVIKVTSSLRVRSGASTSSSVLGYLKNGTKVTITGQDGDWYVISYNGNKGYISKNYVVVAGNNTNTSTSTPQAPKANKTGTVTNVTTNLRVRSGASTNSSVLGYLTNKTKVTITGESGDWYAISYKNKTGYVSKAYISVSNPSGGNATSTPSNNQQSTQTQKVGTVINVTSNLRVRSGAGTNHSTLGYINNGTKVTITGESGDWYAIRYKNKTGYVSKAYISVSTTGNTTNNSSNSNTSSSGNTAVSKTGKVINVSSNLRVRSQPNTSSTVLGYLTSGQTVTITGESGDWYIIKYNNKVGHVSKSYIKIVDPSEANTNSKYDIILNAMKAHIGSPYVWGGSGELITKNLLDTLSKRYPSQAANGAYTRAYAQVNSGKRAFDCSGLMQWGYAQAGISIGRSTWDQITNGVEVSLNNLQPGDLLFSTSLGHVGMYIGNGQWIESPNKNADIRIVSVPWKSIGRARRIL